MAKKYIPDNSWLICNMGEKSTQIKVTHSGSSNLYGEYFVSEADAIPNENILPFGKCAITNKPCKFNPLYWDKCNCGTKVNGYKLVFEDAHLICKEGGEIEADFSIPGGGQLGFLGLSAPLQWLDYNKNIHFVQDRILYDVEKGVISLSNSTIKGNYGEMAANKYMDSQGWQNIRTQHPVLDINAPFGPGIDGAYTKGGVFLVDDAKFNTADISHASYGRELSRPWVEYHLDNGAVMDKHTKALMDANNNGTLKRTVTHIDANGNMSSKTYNDLGYRKGAGPISNIEIPTTKASQLINSVRSTVGNSKPITALSNSNFSKAVQNSATASKANDALWKVTQTIDDIPALKTTGKVLGKGTVVLGITLDVISIGSAYSEEGEFGNKTQQATGSAIGGAAGGWAGAEIGAIIGTAICPGVGTLIGGIVGGIAGGIGGSKAGSAFLDWLF